MMWIGLVVGVVIGALIGELPGAVTLGFLGWLTGLIIGSLKKAKGDALSAGAPVGSTPMPPAHTLEARVMRLEAAIARVEARLSQLDAGTLKPGSVPGLSPISEPGSVPGPSPVFVQPVETPPQLDAPPVEPPV